MSYNGWTNWATWEARNHFGEVFDDLAAYAVNYFVDEDEAREYFKTLAADTVEQAIDTDLKANGLSGQLAMLASDFIEDKINFGEIFDTWLANNPDAFEDEEEDEEEDEDNV